MTAFLSRHRALWGVISVAAAITFVALPSAWPRSETGFFLTRGGIGGLWLLGLIAVAGSPYWKILYREAPLKRAMTGASDLDERELALRDRANGLTYYLFFVANLLLLFGGGIALDVGWIALDGDSLTDATVPYAFFGITLPVIMLEWFEPSHLWAEPDEEEEEL